MIGLLIRMVQADRARLGPVKKISGHSLTHVCAQVLPSIALGENIVRKTLSYITAIIFLRYAEDNFHGETIA